jgi:hypothetical protein
MSRTDQSKSLQVWVTQSTWAIKVSAAVPVALTGPLQDALLKSVAITATSNQLASSFVLDITVLGDTAGRGSRIGLNLNGLEIVVPFCANNNHAQCAADEACWGFVCIRKQPRLGFCTHDVQCQSGKCLDELGLLFCGDCAGDAECRAGTFCEFDILLGDR